MFNFLSSKYCFEWKIYNFCRINRIIATYEIYVNSEKSTYKKMFDLFITFLIAVWYACFEEYEFETMNSYGLHKKSC